MKPMDRDFIAGQMATAREENNYIADLERQVRELTAALQVRDSSDRGDLAIAAVGLKKQVEQLTAERDALQRFKDWVHSYLDGKGVPHHPPGTHGAEGCRIGDRMDYVFAELDRLREDAELLDWLIEHSTDVFPRSLVKHIYSHRGLCREAIDAARKEQPHADA